MKTVLPAGASPSGKVNFQPWGTLGKGGDSAAQLTPTVMSDIASMKFAIRIVNVIFIVLSPRKHNGFCILRGSKWSYKEPHYRQSSTHSGHATS